MKLQNWVKKYSEVIDFNQALKSGNYERLKNLVEFGKTWEGHKSAYELLGIRFPQKPEDIANTIKIILDIGFVWSDNVPVSILIECDENMIGLTFDELISDGILKQEFKDVYDKMPENEEWIANQLKISKIGDKYVINSIRHLSDDDELPDGDEINTIDIEYNRIFDFIEMFCKFKVGIC